MRKRTRITAAFLSAALILSGFSGCAKQEQPLTPTDAATKPISESQSITATTQKSDEPVFMLEKLPEIGGYVDDIIYNRRYPEFRDTLTPGEDYGKLIPFVGTFRDYHFVNYETGEWGDETHSVEKYGLMTDKGEIIVDAVYDYAEVIPCTDGSYIIELSQEGEDEETRGTTLICPADGSWVKTGTEYINYDYENGIGDMIATVDRSEIDWKNSTGAPKTIFYGKDGKKLFEFENSEPANGSVFKEGYLAISFFTDYFNYEYKNRFVDENGNFAFDGVYPSGNFIDGKATARNSDDKEGVFSIEGEWLIKPRFKYISKSGNYYIAKTDSSHWIYDMNGKTVKIISDSELGDKSIEVFGDRIFYSYSDYSQERTRHQYINSETEKPIICKETGLEVTGYIHTTEYFYCNDGKNTYIVNFGGNTVAKLDCVAETINKINDDYLEVVEGYWEDETQTYNIYSCKDFKKLWSQQIKNKGDRIDLWSREDYIVKTYIPEEEYGDEYPENRTYDILEFSTGEPIFENLCSYCSFETNGKIYYCVSDGTYTYTYAPDMTVLMKVRNENND